MKLIVAYANSSDEYLQRVLGVYSSEEKMFEVLRKDLKEDGSDYLEEGEDPIEYVDNLSDEEILAYNEMDSTHITVHEFELDT